MAGFSVANPTPFSTQQMGFDDTSVGAISRFYQMVPIGGARRVTVEHDRDSVLLIGPGGFATVRNTRTGAGIADRLALRGAGQIEIELSGQSDGRMFISIEDGVRTLSHLIVSVKTARQVTYKHWAYTDATVHKPNNIDSIISRTENNIKILFLNQSNIVMSKSTNTEDLNIQFSLQEQSPIDKSNKIIFLDHKAHGWKFAADNETGLSDAINTSGGKGVTVNFLWTPDIEFSPQTMLTRPIGGSTLNPGLGGNVSIVEITSSDDTNLMRAAHEMTHILNGVGHTIAGKEFRYLMEEIPTAVRLRDFEIDRMNPSGLTFAKP